MRYFFFFQAEDGIRDGHVTGVQTCALPISCYHQSIIGCHIHLVKTIVQRKIMPWFFAIGLISFKIMDRGFEDRKSTRLNSSHVAISYAVFCLKKKSKPNNRNK